MAIPTTSHRVRTSHLLPAAKIGSRLHWLGLAASLTLMTACGESRQTQCEKIGTIINQTAEQMMTASPQADGFQQGAALAQTAATNLEALELGDKKLSNLRYHLATAYQDMAQSGLKMAEIADSSGGVTGTPENAPIIQAQRTSTQSFMSVTNATQTYCQGGDVPTNLTDNPPS